MAGTSTVPDVTTADPAYDVSFRMIDRSGDLRTVTIRFPPSGTAPLLAEIQATRLALQAATNASIYEVAINNRFVGAKLAGNADNADPYLSVYDNVALNFKDDVQRLQQTLYIPAPIVTIVGNGDRVVTTNSEYVTVRDAYDALLPSGYEPVSARFTERREKNDSVPA